MMLNTIGDHTKEMSIKLCQTKPAFYTESKTQKRDGTREGGSNKKEDGVNEGGLTLLEFHRDARLIVSCVSVCDGVAFH
jgi:hypothetical protein